MSVNLITPAYTFTPGAAGVGTLNLHGIASFALSRLVAVINVTRKVILYDPITIGYTTLSGTTITLAVDTTGHSSGDVLWVKYDELNSPIGGVLRVPSATQTMPSRARIASSAGTNATSVKASAGAVYHIVAANMATSARFLKLYDKASAPTVGTDTPIATIYLPANGGFAELFDIPIGFSTGIAFAITGLVADTDTTAVALNDIHGFILYA